MKILIYADNSGDAKLMGYGAIQKYDKSLVFGPVWDRTEVADDTFAGIKNLLKKEVEHDEGCKMITFEPKISQAQLDIIIKTQT